MESSVVEAAGSADLDTTRGQGEEDGVRAVLGFRDGSHGAHSARTIMLAELEQLLSDLPADATREDYERAIVEENLLGKPTRFSRKATATHLWELYGLDPAVPFSSPSGWRPRSSATASSRSPMISTSCSRTSRCIWSRS